MANLNRMGIVLLVALGGCGVGTRLNTTLEKPVSKINEGEFLSGTAPDLGGSRIDLATYEDKRLLLIFAGDTCVVCAAETANLIAHQAELAPYDFEIVTILAGADRVTAEEWKVDHHVPWTVGYDEDLELFQKYCPAGTTPCGFVQKPQDGVVLKRSGPIEISELQKLFGN